MASLRLDPAHPAYPPALVTLGAPTLYLRGALPRGPGVAVVGTRRPSAEAAAFTRALVRELAAHGLAIWSGGALGIDAAAHEAALAAGAPTVVVAGGGLDRPYPKEHIPLYDRVLRQGGALLARVPDDVPPMPPGFLLRNAILAALTAATIVVQAGFSSGARNTAAAARRLGRPLGVVPHAPWDEQGAGCALELASLGARPIISAGDVLALLAGEPPAPRRRPSRRRPASPSIGLDFDGAGWGGLPESPPVTIVAPLEEAAPVAAPAELEGAESAIFAVLNEVPAHVDDVCGRTSLPPARVVASLLTLTLRAVVVEGPAGFFRLARRP